MSMKQEVISPFIATLITMRVKVIKSLFHRHTKHRQYAYKGVIHHLLDPHNAKKYKLIMTDMLTVEVTRDRKSQPHALFCKKTTPNL